MAVTFTRNNIDHLLYLLAKEYKRANKANPECELIIVGGASILLNYNFREETTDIDTIVRASSTFKEVANRVGDENGLSNGWVNTDFVKTRSYSKKLVEHSKFYKKFYGCLSVRTITAEYLIAMKLRSFRKYKHDLSDIIGIIKEQVEMGHTISQETITNAYTELYDEPMKEGLSMYLKDIFSAESLEDLFYETIEKEQQNKTALLKAEEDYADVMNEDNIDTFLSHFSKE